LGETTAWELTRYNYLLGRELSELAGWASSKGFAENAFVTSAHEVAGCKDIVESPAFRGTLENACELLVTPFSSTRLC
jgi:hypothetical protein